MTNSASENCFSNILCGGFILHALSWFFFHKLTFILFSLSLSIGYIERSWWRSKLFKVICRIENWSRVSYWRNNDKRLTEICWQFYPFPNLCKCGITAERNSYIKRHIKAMIILQMPKSPSKNYLIPTETKDSLNRVNRQPKYSWKS